MSGLEQVDRLGALADTIAGAWGARARASTSAGQERAILRLFGVHGIDAAGRPLANVVVDRYVGRDNARLGSGIALPFAIAMLEYDLQPQQLALDVASGAIDLTLEAALLGERERRVAAEAQLERLETAAVVRIDANRTARRELLDVLGDAPRPWVGTTLVEVSAGQAIEEAVRRVREAIDLVRVEVPVGRELAERLNGAGIDLPTWPSAPPRGTEDGEPDADENAPTGSQRGLAQIRRAIDEVAAERRAYVRLATAAPALATPEQAVVAGFERIDVVEGDVMAEIVTGSVDPDRALADHAFAQRLLRRAGTSVLIDAGPLVVAPDLRSGVPSDPAQRAGRALALQLLGVRLAIANGLPADQVIVGALPTWLTDEPQPAARAAGELAIRRALLPEHALAWDEPATVPEHAAVWPFLLGSGAADATALVLRRPEAGPMAATVLASRAATAVARELGSAFGPRPLEGDAAAHARSVVTSAIETLERLDGEGWRSILGDAPGGGERVRLGSDLVAERSEALAPLAAPAPLA